MSTLAKRIQQSLANLVTLDIVTAVGPPKADGSGPDYGEDKIMSSKIDLLQGDITNVIDPAFVTGELQTLRSFHETQVVKGEQIVRDNLKALRELYNAAVDYESPAKAPDDDSTPTPPTPPK